MHWQTMRKWNKYVQENKMWKVCVKRLQNFNQNFNVTFVYLWKCGDHWWCSRLKYKGVWCPIPGWPTTISYWYENMANMVHVQSQPLARAKEGFCSCQRGWFPSFELKQLDMYAKECLEWRMLWSMILHCMTGFVWIERQNWLGDLSVNYSL